MPQEELRQPNHVNSFDKPNDFPTEIDSNATGVMIAADDWEMPLVEGCWTYPVNTRRWEPPGVAGRQERAVPRGRFLECQVGDSGVRTVVMTA
ncbi:hypothetical protein CtCNB1_1830 [Comamonas thiooxydans]|nr:hypothetical protein CtCNB1_1830 [Comamonas thiooxydans]